ncbi:hypothetical protein [Methanobacterium spitsbergense]|uniref:Uncharacterized protein n=1 Tax=Methanobacterium spitsbergense TaxID=2874285 RepID=A0A8T5UKV1_9EURY|nr:hypothetical protein [Methanobacterium spitsbergense]MBZ2164508.1 hypothetical protein [Methanobacterium spitsbergense]
MKKKLLAVFLVVIIINLVPAFATEIGNIENYSESLSKDTKKLEYYGKLKKFSFMDMIKLLTKLPKIMKKSVKITKNAHKLNLKARKDLKRLKKQEKESKALYNYLKNNNRNIPVDGSNHTDTNNGTTDINDDGSTDITDETTDADNGTTGINDGTTDNNNKITDTNDKNEGIPSYDLKNADKTIKQLKEKNIAVDEGTYQKIDELVSGDIVQIMSKDDKVGKAFIRYLIFEESLEDSNLIYVRLRADGINTVMAFDEFWKSKTGIKFNNSNKPPEYVVHEIFMAENQEILSEIKDASNRLERVSDLRVAFRILLYLTGVLGIICSLVKLWEMIRKIRQYAMFNEGAPFIGLFDPISKTQKAVFITLLITLGATAFATASLGISEGIVNRLASKELAVANAQKNDIDRYMTN